MRAVIFLALFASACSSPNNDPYYRGSGAKEIASVQLQADGITPYEKGFIVPISAGWEKEPNVPQGVQDLLRSGRRWVVLKEPIVFAGAALPLLQGKTPFIPEEIELKAAHDVRTDAQAAKAPLRAALLIMRGSIDHQDIVARSGIKKVENLTISDLGVSEGIKALDSDIDRIALGRGVDTSLRIVTGRYQQGLAGQSSFDWVATFENGKAVKSDDEWIASLSGPIEERRAFTAIIRRYRPSQDPKVTWFSVPLNVVMLCSQMNVTKESGEPVKWHWEGFWLGRALSVTNAPVAKPPRVTVIYKEFKTKPMDRAGGQFLSSVFDPITRTGTAALDELKRRDAGYVPPK